MEGIGNRRKPDSTPRARLHLRLNELRITRCRETGRGRSGLHNSRAWPYRPAMHHPLRLTIDRTAIQENWHWLQDRSGVAAGAAVKADGYGLGAREASHALYLAGCRDFFVSTWAEAEALGPLPVGASIVVLHGVGPADVEAALSFPARPCLNTPEQVAPGN